MMQPKDFQVQWYFTMICIVVVNQRSYRYVSFLRLAYETIILRQYSRNLIFVVLVAPGIVEEIHKDIYYINGCSQEECLVLLKRYGELLINDGMNRFGFGCHESQDEIMLDKYNVVTIYSQQLPKYNEFLEAHGIEKVENLITVWNTFSDDTPGQAERYDYKGKLVYDLPEELKDWGMYLADTRAE